MSYRRKVIFAFDTKSDTGINKITVDSIVMVLNTNQLYNFIDLTGLTDTSTVQEAIDGGNLIEITYTSQLMAIDELTDVDTSTNAPTNGQTLKWDGTNWVPADDDQGSTINSLDDIGDVNVSNVQENQVLTRVGSEWTAEWVLSKVQKFNFDSTQDQTDFIITGVVFTTADVLINGVEVRDNLYNINDDGTDTTISFVSGLNLNDWVLIKV
jgi:hypothetical protein